MNNEALTCNEKRFTGDSQSSIKVLVHRGKAQFCRHKRTL